ncbi:MAG: hypothetical protein ACFE8C_04140 [Promethearchaeota archaeon]
MKVKELWSFKYNEPILGIELGDINNNGEIEIIAYTRTGALLFLSQNSKKKHQEVITKDIPIWHLKIYDIDNDGRNEIILGGMDGILRTFKCSLTYDLVTFWNHKFNTSISGILIDDINNDNISELIVYSLDKTIRVLNPLDGNLIWGQVFEEGIGDAIVLTDEKKIVIACGNDGTIRSFNGIDGKLVSFKQFSDKIRCVSYLNSIKGCVVICGGDDKKLHFLDKKTQKEFKTNKFKDYVWKCISYPFPIFNKALISSYSFAYFNKLNPLEKIDFTSKLICIDEYFTTSWKLEGFNIEILKAIKVNKKILVFVGTTKGELIIIEEQTGKILFQKKENSCLNMIQILIEERLMFCSYDDGTVTAYKWEENLI